MKNSKFIVLGFVCIAQVSLALAMNQCYKQIQISKEKGDYENYIKSRVAFIKESVSSEIINDLSNIVLDYIDDKDHVEKETEKLCDAIINNDFEAAQKALQNGAFVSYVHKHKGYTYSLGNSMIMLVIDKLIINNTFSTFNNKANIEQVLQFLKLFISNGANLNFVDDKGNTALMKAIKMCNYEIVKILVESGADIEIENALFGHTAYVYANKLLQECLAGESKVSIENYLKIVDLLSPEAEATRLQKIEAEEKENKEDFELNLAIQESMKVVNLENLNQKDEKAQLMQKEQDDMQRAIEAHKNRLHEQREQELQRQRRAQEALVQASIESSGEDWYQEPEELEEAEGWGKMEEED